MTYKVHSLTHLLTHSINYSLTHSYSLTLTHSLLLTHSGEGISNSDELLARRINRADKLTLTWRNTMLNQWAVSLYSARRERYSPPYHLLTHSPNHLLTHSPRYIARAAMVSKAIDVYHSQYENLKHTIIAERGNLVEIYRVLDGELELIGNEEKNFISFHTSFLDRCLRQLEGQLESVMDLFRDALGRFQQHCGAIKRHALERVRVASNALNASMEESCTGLITGYTGSYAQGYSLTHLITYSLT